MFFLSITVDSCVCANQYPDVGCEPEGKLLSFIHIVLSHDWNDLLTWTRWSFFSDMVLKGTFQGMRKKR